jgi:hypothetical protein
MNSATAVAENARTASYISDYDAISKVIESYNEAVRAGNSALMKASFHSAATFFGYYKGDLLAGPCQILFDWVDGNGPIEGLRVRQASIDIFQTIAVVRLEMENVTGKLSDPSGATLSDLFQLIKIQGEWKISQKSFHWH